MSPAPDEPQTYSARWVFPASGPPLPNGTVTVRGDRIAAVDPAGARSAAASFGTAAIVPGLVTPHTPLDLSGARGQIPPTDPDHFTDWLRGVIAYRRTRTPEQVQADMRHGLASCLEFGTTLIGDITVGGASYPAVSAAVTRAVLFWELIGLNRERIVAASTEWGETTGISWHAEADEPCPNTPTVRWGASPHAPYSANNEYALCLLWGTRGPK